MSKLHMRDLEHPDITRVRREGLPEAPEIHCPFCGGECERIYKGGGVFLGCNLCVEVVEATEEELENLQI